MKRSLAVLAFVVVLSATTALAGCSNGGATTTPPALAAATEADDGKSIPLADGQMLSVSLPANPSTGFTWVVTALPSVVETVGEPAFETGAQGESAIVGAGGTMTYTLRAKGSGSGKLELGYKRPWETDVAPERTFTLDITVE